MAMYLVTLRSCMFDMCSDFRKIAKSRADVDEILNEFHKEGYIDDNDPAFVFQLGKKMTVEVETKFTLKDE